jgi:hypothetical protein
VAPDRIEQGFTLDCFAGARQEHQQHGVRLGLHADHLVAATHADRARTHLDVLEAVPQFVLAMMFLHVWANGQMLRFRLPSVGTSVTLTSVPRHRRCNGAD